MFLIGSAKLSIISWFRFLGALWLQFLVQVNLIPLYGECVSTIQFILVCGKWLNYTLDRNGI